MKIKLASLVLIIFLMTTSAVAQTKHEKAVASVVEQLRKAMIDGDEKLLQGLASDQLSYGHSGGLVDDKKEFVAKIASGRSDFVTIELSEQTITISEKTAVVRHSLHATTNDNGKPGEVKLKVVLIWQKQQGKWKLLARQAVKPT